MADLSILDKLRQQLAAASVDALLIPRGDVLYFITRELGVITQLSQKIREVLK